MNLKDAKVGTEVKVVSEFGVCGVEGYIGKISKVINSSSYVYVLFDILPCYYGAD